MKLHLGCGKRHIPGFVHIDAVDYAHVDHVATIDNLGFIGDDSVDLIYNCHVLEHFRRREGRETGQRRAADGLRFPDDFGALLVRFDRRQSVSRLARPRLLLALSRLGLGNAQ